MRKWIKFVVLAVTYVLVLPFGLVATLTWRTLRSPVVYEFLSETFSVVPGMVGKYVRLCFYKQTLREVHFDSEFCFGSLISKIETRLGKGVKIGGHTVIGLCDVGDEAVISGSVSVLSGRYQHNFTDSSRGVFDGAEAFARVSIGDHVFIGERSVVMADVGPGTVVGAGSIVVKSLPANVVAVGNPCRVVKERG